jgi:hypothetical protein
MFELLIKKLDGSIHWKEHFNTIEDAQKWITEEQTRTYWDATNTFEITDKTPPPMSDADKAVIAAKDTQVNTFKQRIKALANQPDLTAAEIKEAIFKYIKMKVMQGEL